MSGSPPAASGTLTKQLIQGSSRYQALRPVLRTAADKLAAAACVHLDATSRLKLTEKAAPLTAYKKAVDALAGPGQGWLTAAQAAALKSLADTL